VGVLEYILSIRHRVTRTYIARTVFLYVKPVTIIVVIHFRSADFDGTKRVI